MQKLQLDSLDILSVQILYGLKHVRLCLAGKAEDRVDDDIYSPSAKFRYSGLEYRKIIASSDITGSSFVNSLKYQLDPHRFDLIQTFQKI